MSPLPCDDCATCGARLEPRSEVAHHVRKVLSALAHVERVGRDQVVEAQTAALAAFVLLTDCMACSERRILNAVAQMSCETTTNANTNALNG